MGVFLYKDMIRFYQEELKETCPDLTCKGCMRERVRLLKKIDVLQLSILKQMGWA